MTLATQLEDAFPHGTVQGYSEGCKGRICHAPVSCSEVRLRYISDWGYRKLIDAGYTAIQIIEREQAEASAEKQRAREAKKVNAAPKLRAKKQRASGELAPIKGKWRPEVIPAEAHGKETGYRYGCRLGTDCPGNESVGKSCTQANRNQARRRAEAPVDASASIVGADPGVALSMLNAGVSRVKISQELGISYKTAIRALKRDAALLAQA